MDNYFEQYATQQLWCNNDIDNQYVFSPTLVSSVGGVLNQFTLMSRNVILPKPGKYYNVYQIGQLHPILLGLTDANPDWFNETWLDFKTAINTLNITVNVYNTYGIELSRSNCWYMFTNTKALIFAIELDANIPVDYRNDSFYFRLYNNAYLNTPTLPITAPYMYCNGIKPLVIQDILDLQTEYNIYVAKPYGHTYAYCNGLLVSAISPLTCHVGDTIEYVYDSSVKQVVSLTVNTLAVFTSALDAQLKYLIHYPNTGNTTIDYADDIDIHILYTDSQGRQVGCYYYRNLLAAIRMVTHRDYSIPVDYFTLLARHLSQTIPTTIPANPTATLDLRSYTLEIKIRNGGNPRPLWWDNSRIFELYKLPDTVIVEAMTGVNSTFTEWQASNLESCGYVRIMQANRTDILPPLVESAYGYNALAKLVGDTPIPLTLSNSRPTCALPYGLYMNCTVYEYDINGLMLGYYYSSGNPEYVADNTNAVSAECISGQWSITPDVVEGVDQLVVNSNYEYRVYQCSISGGLPDHKWIDITESGLFTVANNLLTWGSSVANHYLMVRSARTFLVYDITLTSTGGCYEFVISSSVSPLTIELGQLDIFMNGYSLIEGLDYTINYPAVYITNTSYLVSGNQNIHVRFTGFCNPSMLRDSAADYGFVEYGVLSNNSVYNTRDDRVLRFTVGGRLVHRSSLLFSENTLVSNTTSPLNGVPYQVKEIVVPLGNYPSLVGTSTYDLRVMSEDIDSRLSKYLTLHSPQPTRPTLDTITNKYRVVSPFFSRLINYIVHQTIDTSVFSTLLSDNDILNILSQFDYLIPYDPLYYTTPIDSNFVQIIPHSLGSPVPVSIYSYRFLMSANRLYYKNSIDLTNYLTIIP